MHLRIKLLDHFDKGLGLPTYGSTGASGVDLKACFNDRGHLTVNPGQRVLIPTGISVEIPVGYEWQIRPRSGLAAKSQISVLNTPGTIDADYRGEIKVILINMSDKVFVVEKGSRIAQMVLCPVIKATLKEVTELENTKRGSDGFGSTGIK